MSRWDEHTERLRTSKLFVSFLSLSFPLSPSLEQELESQDVSNVLQSYHRCSSQEQKDFIG